MPKATLPSGIRLHYQQVGNGPDLVLVHGLTGNLAVWHLHMVPMLSEHFRVLTYDLRGHGYSDVPPAGYSPDDMAEDLLGLLDVLGIDQAAIVGHSYGADTALYLAHHHPSRVTAVVAVEAALPAMISMRAREEWSGWRYWSDVLERSGHPVPPEHRCDPDYLLRQSLLVPKKWGPLQGLPRRTKPFLRLLDETTMSKDVEQVGGLPLEAIPEITAPVTLLYCESSAFEDTFAYLSEHLPDVRPVLLPRTEWGHFGPLEQPAVVAAEVLTALGIETTDPKETVDTVTSVTSVKNPAAAAASPDRSSQAVIVTGASTGLGLETAIHLALAGYAVYATVRDLSMRGEVEAAAAERGVSLRVLRLDLTDAASITAAVGQVVAETGGVHALVNNGGLGLRGCLEDLAEAEIRALFEANVFGTIAAIKAVLPHMRAARRGRIITISSVGGRISSFGVSAYCSTKFAQEGLGEALALEVAPFGIQAVLIEPGIIKTTRWTTNRATAPGALSPTSAYRDLFQAGEVLADRVVDRSRTTAADVAKAVVTAITVDKPRMRYVVGQPAGIVILLRRYLPSRTFERIYFGAFLRDLQKRAALSAAARGAERPTVVTPAVVTLPERESAPAAEVGAP